MSGQHADEAPGSASVGRRMSRTGNQGPVCIRRGPNLAGPEIGGGRGGAARAIGPAAPSQVRPVGRIGDPGPGFQPQSRVIPETTSEGSAIEDWISRDSTGRSGCGFTNVAW